VKRSEVLSNKISNIIRRYIDHMKCSARMAFPFTIFFHVLLVPFFIIVCKVYVLYTFVFFYKLCIFIVVFMYSYCNVRSVLYTLFPNWHFSATPD